MAQAGRAHCLQVSGGGNAIQNASRKGDAWWRNSGRNTGLHTPRKHTGWKRGISGRRYQEGKAVRFEQKTWGRRHPSGKKEAWSIAPGPSRRSEAAEAEENTCLSGKLVARGSVKGRPKKANHKHKGKVPGPQASFRKTATKQPGREAGRSRSPTAGPRTPRSPAFALFCPPLGRTW